MAKRSMRKLETDVLLGQFGDPARMLHIGSSSMWGHEGFKEVNGSTNGLKPYCYREERAREPFGEEHPKSSLWP